jgi:chemotaxis protein CheD
MATTIAEINGQQIVVDMADMKATNTGAGWLTTYVLGSGVAVAIHDPVTQVSGLLHFILPSSQLDRKRALNNPYYFGDTGIPLLYRRAYKLGAEKDRLICKIAGGGDVLEGKIHFGIGADNHKVAREILLKNNANITAEYPGGINGMRLHMNAKSGQVIIQFSNGDQIEI